MHPSGFLPIQLVIIPDKKGSMMKKILLYYFSDIHISKDLEENKFSFIYIDPYPAMNPEWEKRIQKESLNGLSRMIWAPLENDLMHNVSNIELLKYCFPNASSLELEKLIASFDNTEYEVPSKIYEAVFMAQRTLIGLRKYTDVLFYCAQVYTFWKCYLKYNKVESIISTLIPHSLTDFLMANAAQDLGISYICQDVAGMARGSFYVDLTRSNHLRNSFSSAFNSSRAIEKELYEFIESCDISKDRFRYAEDLEKHVCESKRQHSRFLRSGSSGANQIVEHKTRLARSYDLKVRGKKINSKMTGYKHYLFLHYQPEASSMPASKIYADQHFSIKRVIQELGPEDILIVKEHPRQFLEAGGLEQNKEHIDNVLGYRTSQFYDYVINHEKAYLCDRNLSIKTILDDPKSIVWSANGTINLQAYIAGRKVMGLNTYSPYKDLSFIENENESTKHRKEIAYAILKDKIWPSFRLDRQVYLQGLEALSLIKNLIASLQTV